MLLRSGAARVCEFEEGIHDEIGRLPGSGAVLTDSGFSGHGQPTQGPGLVDRFLCHCSDCRKISSSLFCANFTVADTHLRHVRGRDRLQTYGQARTIRSGALMTNYFCSTCGSLMYRVGAAFPGMSILRLGSVDDFTLAETKLRPQVEQFVETRACWLKPMDGVKQVEGIHSLADIEGVP